MPLILAVDPDRRQAAHIASVLRGSLRTEVVIAESATRALDALGSRIPDVLLMSPLLSWHDEAALAARLRDLGSAAAHVQALTIPILATSKPVSQRRGILSMLRRRRTCASTPEGCEPAVFAEQVALYLERASAERTAYTGSDPASMDSDPVPADATAPSPELLEEAPAVPARAHPGLAARLRELASAAQVQTFTIAMPSPPWSALQFEDVLSALRRGRAAASTPENGEQASAPAPPPTPVEQVPELATEEAPVAIEKLAAPLETEVREDIEPVVAIPPEETPPVPAVERPRLSARLRELAAAAHMQALTLPTLTASLPLSGLRDVLSALRRRRHGVSAPKPSESAPAPEPAQAAPVVRAPEPELPEVIEIATEPLSECIPLMAMAPDDMPTLGVEDEVVETPVALAAAADDADEAWVAVALDELCDAAAVPAAPPDDPPESDDVWVLTPIPEDELFAVLAPPAAVSVREPVMPMPAPPPLEQPAQSTIAVQVREMVLPSQPSVRKKPGRPKKKPVQDEWGFFDPEQCGFAALLDKLDEVAEGDEAAEKREDTTVRLIAY